MTSKYNIEAPWNKGLPETAQVLPLINDDAPVMRVEAGPGAGKTSGLVRRVERLVHSSGLRVAGDDVLVVAFNRVIAKDLAASIAKQLDGVECDGMPEIHTVHALCLRVIGGNLRILLEHEREMMLYDVLTAVPALRARFKRQPECEQALHYHEAQHRLDTELWQAVFRWLTRHSARLISELPKLLLDSIKQGDYTELQYQHVIVDEFQDLTPGEQALFLRLRKSGGQFVALGDPRQSIYAFRGNDRLGLRNLDGMAALNGETVTDVALPECLRCPPQVVTAANQLMKLYPPEMLGGSTETANVHVVTWKSLQAEAKGMARAILENMKQFPTERHLVMTSRRQFGYLLRDELLALDSTLSIDLSFSETMLESWAVREAFIFSSLVIDPDAPAWRAWLGYGNSDTGEDYKVPERNSDAYLKFLSSCEDHISEERVIALAESATKPLGMGSNELWKRAKRYASLRSAVGDFGGNPTELFQRLFASEIWVNPSMPDKVQAATDLELLRSRMQELVDEHAEEHPAAEPFAHVQFAMKQVRYQIATREPFVAPATTQLQVSTLWGAKGVTAEHVYIVGVEEEAIPGAYRPGYAGTPEEYMEEQRRLFYVSLTRARKTLVLSRATSATFKESKKCGLAIKQTTVPKGRITLRASVFVRDIINQLPEAIPGETWAGCSTP